jgi:hypothetical protein
MRREDLMNRGWTYICDARWPNWELWLNPNSLPIFIFFDGHTVKNMQLSVFDGAVDES